jgi:hypothetical protein
MSIATLKKMLRCLAVSSLTLVMGGVGGAPLAPTALAATPASLNGEVFTGQGDTRTLDGDCSSPGNGSFTFSTSGTATGPYPGTFSESGTFTISTDHTNGLPAVTAYSATFTITSSAGNVTGTKALANEPEAKCDPETSQVAIPASEENELLLGYTASIDNNYQTGSVSLWLVGSVDESPALLQSFDANFSSAPAASPGGEPEGDAPIQVRVGPAITPAPRPTPAR